MSATQDVTLYTDSSGKNCHSESIPSQLDANMAQVNVINAGFALKDGTTWKPLRLNAEEALIVTGFEGSQTDAGKSFRAFDYQNNVSINTALAYLIKVPAAALPHMNYAFTCTKGALFNIYENPTVTANGTSIQVYNDNRNSAIASVLTAFLNPTTTANGTLVDSFLIPGANQGGSSTESVQKIILKSNEDYLITVNSLDNGNKILSKFIWFE